MRFAFGNRILTGKTTGSGWSAPHLSLWQVEKLDLLLFGRQLLETCKRAWGVTIDVLRSPLPQFWPQRN
ncbi:MAG: hypothetical protein P8H36_11125 [Yoonia sp.]|jgi:hypothetical protein|nr:hypothetical protein [Yoonia sp.]